MTTLKRQIVALAMSKLNCLHLHIVDVTSNAFAAETAPADNMQKAAYVSGKRYLYSMDDIRDLTAFARPLGIFIMVEYDMPGHAKSWRLADPAIAANCPSHGYSSVNPTNELTF